MVDRPCLKLKVYVRPTSKWAPRGRGGVGAVGCRCPAGWAAGPPGGRCFQPLVGEGGTSGFCGTWLHKYGFRGRGGLGQEPLSFGKTRTLCQAPWLHPVPTARQVLGDPRCPQGGTCVSPRCRRLRAPRGGANPAGVLGLGGAPILPKKLLRRVRARSHGWRRASASPGRLPPAAGFQKGEKKNNNLCTVATFQNQITQPFKKTN